MTTEEACEDARAFPYALGLPWVIGRPQGGGGVEGVPRLKRLVAGSPAEVLDPPGMGSQRASKKGPG